MTTDPISDFLGYDIDDPAGTAARYDELLTSAAASGSPAALRSLYSRLDSVMAITGGYSRAIHTVLGQPPHQEPMIPAERRASLEKKASQFGVIERIAIDAAARTLEFLLQDEPS